MHCRSLNAGLRLDLVLSRYVAENFRGPSRGEKKLRRWGLVKTSQTDGHLVETGPPQAVSRQRASTRSRIICIHSLNTGYLGYVLVDIWREAKAFVRIKTRYNTNSIRVMPYTANCPKCNWDDGCLNRVHSFSCSEAGT